MRIKIADGRQTREILQASAQDDIQQADLVHVDSPLPAQEGLQNLGAAVSQNEDVLQSLGTVLEKIKMIADATANVVGVVAQASDQFQHLNRLRN